MAEMAREPGNAGTASELTFGGKVLDGWRRFLDSDVFYSFKRSPLTMVAFAVTVVLFLGAFLAPWIAPHDTTNLASLNLMDAFKPPVWSAGGDASFPLGTDDQGRDMLSGIMFGMQASLVIGFASVLLAAIIGTILGLISGYVGGRVDSVIMRVADIQLTFPAILIALLVDGIVGSVLPRNTAEELTYPVLILAIASSLWVNFARTVRGSTLVEKNREYVQAAKVIGIHPTLIMVRHVLPNVMGPVLVIGTLSLALAVLTEATLSFLGVGIPSSEPSLGTLIRIGQEYLFSGEWWMTIFPGVALVILVLAVNLLGDWLRDALNPKLR
ncbi:ABC transporter permease [Algihabitans sp.]|uniref:ABC transporter permease n=1 Tax=Algihabitans sp. TaxID=2821514 RepID=UPI003BA97684